MDLDRLRLLGDNIRTFLLSRKSREVVVFMFFVLISAGFWLLQTLNDTYETTLHMPIRLLHVPEGTIITTDLPEEVVVTVRDKGSALISYTFMNNPSHVVDFDFQAYDEGDISGHVVIPHAEVQKLVNAQVEPTTRVLSLKPDTLEYYFNRGVKKRVPVLFRGQIDTDPLFYLADISCEPDTVTVWADPQELDSLSAVSTVNTIWQDISRNVSRKVKLAQRKGLKMEPDEIMLSATVDVYTEKRVEVPIVGTNFPAGYVLRTFPSSASVSFRIGAKDFKNVGADNFVITATYEELMARPDSLLDLHLRSIPAGVSQVKIYPENVQFLIEHTEGQ